MEGNPAHFEAIGNRLGFQIIDDTDRALKLVWRGARFPAFLCLGIASALLLISIPIGAAIHFRGFAGPAGALWYFPVMNVILFIISVYLIFVKRTILLDDDIQQLIFTKTNPLRKVRLRVRYAEVRRVDLGIDQVYAGFAVAGSSAAQSFPVPSLRLQLSGGDTVLLDRGSARRLRPLAERVAEKLHKPLQVDPALQAGGDFSQGKNAESIAG
jgi:hypothetical protein